MTAKAHPDLENYVRLRESGQDCALCLELPADLETPVSAYLKLKAADRSGGMGFLLESVERGETLGRYSFIGTGIQRRVELQGSQCTLCAADGSSEVLPTSDDPLAFVHQLLRQRSCAQLRIPPLLGGAVGYLGYDLVRQFERLPEELPDRLGLPDGILLLPDTIVEFDHATRLIRILSLPDIDEADPQRAWEAAAQRLETARQALQQPLDLAAAIASTEDTGKMLFANQSQEQYEDAVRRAKEYIAAGDIFQVVLSQRLTGQTTAAPFQIYRALRLLNPSPYMFFLDFGELKLIGSSPEVLVKLSGSEALLNPIAGTRPRGADAEQDRQLEAELLASEKERAEHVMLVDLARNDLGRVSVTGSVKVPQFMKAERFSHVMHLVSNVTGTLAPGEDSCSLLRACFPAGTVSGAPKVRAMQIIEELEPSRRGPYSGAVGYFGADGDMDMCITIRTLVMQGQTYHLQAGAGIVADSEPEAEYNETLAKMAALREAIRKAEEGL